MASLFVGKFHLDNVRIIFPKIFPGQEEQFNQKGDPYWNASFLIPRDHPQLAALKAKQREAAQHKWPNEWETRLATFAAKDKLCLHDGDLKADKYPYYKGMLYVSARNNSAKGPAPGVYDNVIDPATGQARVIKTPADPRAPYSGCYVNAILSLFPYDAGGGQGVGASILGVQFHADGERLSGGGIAKAGDFQAIPGTTAAMPDVPGAAAPPTGAKDAASLF